ncbi:putative H/ACA ribonucleoprotein complex, subunit Gar1/Naf1 [Septoria linicola]|nr:putative H/ACA ribonucleoprotein complex, subunit Gar1/Naf1 [Septoria linicola]
MAEKGDDQFDLHEADEARPAKRMRLEAPLDVTTDTRDEMQDEDDWDDVYGATNASSAQQTAAAPTVEVQKDEVPDPISATANATAPTEAPPSHITAPAGEHNEQLPDGVPAEAIADAPSGSGVVSGEQQAAVVGRSTEPSVQVEKADVPMLDTDGLLSRPDKVTDDPEFMAAAEAQKGKKDSEWQFDSSDAESSSDSDTSSDDSSDDSDSGSEDAYELLDPATAAKMLMAEEGGDEDGGNKNKKDGEDSQPRTANEVKETVIPKPDVTITEETELTLLGHVSSAVENMILIKGATPGEYQVLESGSVLCNEKREVVGAVSETFGRVQEPLYSVAFTNSKEIEDAGLEFGSKVYYVDSHSTFVFTQPLKNLKGTDASNLYDEEVNEDDQDFSDDEKEAEYKRYKKLFKKSGRGGLSRGAFVQGDHLNYASPSASDDHRAFAGASDAPAQQYGGGMSYDDDEGTEDFFTPLKRPDNLSDLMASGGGPPPPRPQQSFDRGRGRGRGDRGDRGRGRGDRGRGRGRGGFEQRQQRGGGERGGFRGGQQQHNNRRGDGRSFADRQNDHNNSQTSNTPAAAPYAPPTQQYQAQPPPQQQQQPPAAQTYQFGGYQFQYGNQPQAAPVQQQQQQQQQQQYQNYYAQQQQAAAVGQPPAGSYVNPAYYQQQQQQQAQAYAAYAQQYPQAYAAQPQANPGAPTSLDIGSILRNLGHRPQPPPQ